MVRSTSVESEVAPTPTQNVSIQISNLGSGAALLSQSVHNTIFGSNIVSAPTGTTSAGTTDVPRWEQSDLTETSDALYYEGASRRRGALAPPEVGDAPDDEIVVSINLKDQHRRDPTTRFTFTDDSGEVTQQWRLFGDKKSRTPCGCGQLKSRDHL